MKKILFITHEYYPFGSAITNCLNPIIKQMQEQDIEVFVLTRKSTKNLKDYEIIDNVKVLRVPDHYLLLLEKRESIYKNSKSKIKKLIVRIYFHLVWLQKKFSIEDGYFTKNKTIKYGKKLLKKENIDTIISCSFPFTSHKIGSKLKKRNNIWIAYQFDPYTYNYTLMTDGKTKKRLKIELKYLKQADSVFITIENYNENMKTELKKLDYKYVVLPYALIKKTAIVKKPQNKEINLTFTGTLYEHLREPYKMLEILNKFDYKINIYYASEEPIIIGLKKYQELLGSKLKLFFKKSKLECDKALVKTNIIINIGNTMINQTPSKVFELISLGKPIINFYTNALDTSKEILKDYPICYNIDVNNFNDYNDLKQFCEKNKNTVLPFEEATKKYLKSEEVALELIKEVEKIENRQNKK
ncbi:MAG: hypothetical protein RR404_00895 [Bacilli bacterium]